MSTRRSADTIEMETIPVYGGIYFVVGAAKDYCDGMNDMAGVPKCPTGALRLEGPYVVKALDHGGMGDRPLGYVVTKED